MGKKRSPVGDVGICKKIEANRRVSFIGEKMMAKITAAEEVARKELLDTLKKGEKYYLEGHFSTGEEVSTRIDKTLEKIKSIDLEKGEKSGPFRTAEELMSYMNRIDGDNSNNTGEM